MTATVHHPNHPSLHHDPAAAALALAASDEERARGVLQRAKAYERTWVAGRLVLAAFFLVVGADKLIHFRGYTTALFDLNVGDPEIPLGLAMVLELVAGVALGLGIATRKVSTAVAIYLVGNALMAWAYLPAQWAQVVTVVNAAVLGAMLLLSAHGAGNLSLDRRAARQFEG